MAEAGVVDADILAGGASGVTGVRVGDGDLVGLNLAVGLVRLVADAPLGLSIRLGVAAPPTPDSRDVDEVLTGRRPARPGPPRDFRVAGAEGLEAGAPVVDRIEDCLRVVDVEGGGAIETRFDAAPVELSLELGGPAREVRFDAAALTLWRGALVLVATTLEGRDRASGGPIGLPLAADLAGDFVGDLGGGGCSTILTTPVGRKNMPCPGSQSKYLSPCTEPSFLPVASSNSTPTHSPV